MKVRCYPTSAQHQKDAMKRFAAGLTKHGINSELGEVNEPQDCDLAVFWGHRQYAIIQRQRSRGAHYLVMERGFIGDRFLWTSLGFDGLNGRATFPKIDDNWQRWDKHFEKYLKPWKRFNGFLAVIMGQVHGDESIRGVDFDNWIQTTAAWSREFGFDVWFRPHPGRPHDRPSGLNVMQGSLREALAAAGVVLTYNSNAGVDAILNGVPAYAQDPGSMIWNRYTSYLKPISWPRKEWTAKMAYTQWLPEEIESGAAWEALRTVGEK